MLTRLFQDHTTARALSARTPEQSLQMIMESKRLASFRIWRHHIIGPFVVDYLFAEAALIVELKDPRTFGNEQDRNRVRMLETVGYSLVRLSRQEVAERPGLARQQILKALQESAATPAPAAQR
jgi:very-short-patch-repair endonuclease